MNSFSHIIRVTICAVSLTASTGTLASPATADDSLKRIQQSLVRIKVSGTPALQTSGANPPFWGTGFIVSREGHILTALHTLKADGFWERDLDGKPKRTIQVWRMDSTTNTLLGDEMFAQFHERDHIATEDAAVIKISGSGYEEVRCRKTEPVIEDATYYRIGFVDVASQPQLNSRPGTRVRSLDKLLPRFTFSVPSKVGMSGGPIIDGRGIVRAYITSGDDGKIENKIETYGLSIERAEAILPDTSRCKRGLKLWDDGDDPIESERDLTSLLDFSEMQYLDKGATRLFRSFLVFGNYTTQPLSTIVFGTAIGMKSIQYYTVMARKIILREHWTRFSQLKSRAQLTGQGVRVTGELFDTLFNNYCLLGEEIGYFNYEHDQEPTLRGGEVVRLLGGNTQPRIQDIPGGIAPINDSAETDQAVVVCVAFRASTNTDLKIEGKFGHFFMYDTQRAIMLATLDNSLSMVPESIRKTLTPQQHGAPNTALPIKKSRSGTVLDLVNLHKHDKVTIFWGWDTKQ